MDQQAGENMEQQTYIPASQDENGNGRTPLHIKDNIDQDGEVSLHDKQGNIFKTSSVYENIAILSDIGIAKQRLSFSSHTP